MHHNFFEKEKSLPLTGFRTVQPYSITSEISSLLCQYTGGCGLGVASRWAGLEAFLGGCTLGLMNALAEKQNLPSATWMELLDELLTSSPTSLSNVSPQVNPAQLCLFDVLCVCLSVCLSICSGLSQ